MALLLSPCCHFLYQSSPQLCKEKGKGKEPNQKEKRKGKKGMKTEEAAPGPVRVARTHLTAPQRNRENFPSRTPKNGGGTKQQKMSYESHPLFRATAHILCSQTLRTNQRQIPPLLSWSFFPLLFSFFLSRFFPAPDFCQVLESSFFFLPLNPFPSLG